MGPEGRGPEPLPAQGAAQQVLAQCSAPVTSPFVQPNKEILLRTVPFAASIHPPGARDCGGGGGAGASRGLQASLRPSSAPGARVPFPAERRPWAGGSRQDPGTVPVRSWHGPGAILARRRHDPGAIPALARAREAAAAAGRQRALWSRGRRSGRAAASLAPHGCGGHHGPQPVSAVQRCGGGGGGRGREHGVQQALALQRSHPPHRGARPPGGSGPRARCRSAAGGCDAIAPRAGGDTGEPAGTNLGHSGDLQETDPGAERGDSGKTPGNPAGPSGSGWCRGFSRVVFPRPAVSQVIAPAEPDPAGSPEGARTELDEEMENDICKVWDMSMDEVGALSGTSGRICPECSVRIVVAVGEGTKSAARWFRWCCSRPGVLGRVRQHSWAGAAPSSLTTEPALREGQDSSWN